MLSKYKIRVCLQTYNRPHYAKLALESLINQKFDGFDIYISDSSSDNEFYEYYLNNYDGFANIKFNYRNSNLSAIEHFNLLIEESKSFDFVMFFHDDDVLFDNYFSELINSKLLDDEKNVAIGINAFKLLDYQKTKIPIIFSNKDIVIESKLKLINQYFNFEYNGAVPFPGYMYRVKPLLNLKLDIANGGKFSDLPFLLGLIEFGNIYWICKPLMFYRIHNNNDSNFISMSDRESLFNYLDRSGLLTSNLKYDFKLVILKEFKKHNQISNFNYCCFFFKYILYNFYRLRIFNIVYLKLIKSKFIGNV